jgi:putative hemolysin
VRQLQVVPTFKADDLSNIPATGPLVIIANHPYGVLDGLAMCWLIEKVRKDFLVLTHSVLLRAPEARTNLLPVDFTGTKEAFQTNLESRDAARKHLAQGGCVVVFPAGAVSTAPDKLGRKPAIDWPWQPFTAQLIQRSKATVVPIFFSGQNSRLFQIASHLSPTLRLSLIFKEVHDRIGTELPLVIGKPITHEELAPVTDRQTLLSFLRERTYALESLLEFDTTNVVPFGKKMKSPVVNKMKRFIHKLETRRAMRERLRNSA